METLDLVLKIKEETGTWLSVATVDNYTHQRTTPKADIVALLAKIFKIPIEDLFTE